MIIPFATCELCLKSYSIDARSPKTSQVNVASHDHQSVMTNFLSNRRLNTE